MKLTKAFMILQTIGMYLSQIPLIAIFIIAIIDKENNLSYLSDLCGKTYQISLIVVVIIAIINIIISFLSIRKDYKDLSKFTMILKTYSNTLVYFKFLLFSFSINRIIEYFLIFVISDSICYCCIFNIHLYDIYKFIRNNLFNKVAN